MAEDAIKEKEIVFGRWADSLERSAVNYRYIDRVPIFIVTYHFGDEAVEKLKILFATTFDAHMSRAQYRHVVFDLNGLTILQPSGTALLRELSVRLRSMGGDLFLAANTLAMSEKDRRLLESEFNLTGSVEDAIARIQELRAGKAVPV
ncbi:MAG: hypothetical protein IT210_07955 [Armatimonadetes bacterium]|nr:hypothetical protein [Armatimonadota bacterium]